MPKTLRSVACLMLAVPLTLLCGGTFSQPASPPGQLTIGVASTAGGGYDSYARLIAAHLSKYLPGKPTIVVANMSGAGGNMLARYISNSVPHDGSWVALVLPSTIMSGLYESRSRLQYDPSQLIQIGSPTSEIDLCFARADSGVHNLDDALAKPLTVGASAVGGSTRDQPLALNTALKTKFRIVAGYPGTREIMLAIERGEVEGVCGMSYSGMKLQKPDWLASGFVLPILQNHMRGDADLLAKGVKRSVDAPLSDLDRKALELLYSPQEFGRPFVVAEATPKDRVEALRDAFDKVLQDSELLADANRLRLEIHPVSGRKLQALSQRLYAAPAAVVKRASDLIRPKP